MEVGSHALDEVDSCLASTTGILRCWFFSKLISEISGSLLALNHSVSPGLQYSATWNNCRAIPRSIWSRILAAAWIGKGNSSLMRTLFAQHNFPQRYLRCRFNFTFRVEDISKQGHCMINWFEDKEEIFSENLWPDYEFKPFSAKTLCSTNPFKFHEISFWNLISIKSQRADSTLLDGFTGRVLSSRIQYGYLNRSFSEIAMLNAGSIGWITANRSGV